MKMTNWEIYNKASELAAFIKDSHSLYIPVKGSFYINKNINQLTRLGEEIEKERIKIGEKYGSLNEDNTMFIIDESHAVEANNEVNSLMSLEQDVTIYMISLADLGDISMTNEQMNTLMFMIEEE